MALLERVRATVSEHQLFSPGDGVVVAVSGGPDSLALLHILRALQVELQIRLHVAHLNHELRGAESDADAEFVAGLARDWNLPATIEARDVAAWAREKHLSLEEAARHIRYRFLAEVAERVRAQVIAVGHNADDQVETILMHFLRGAGLAGLRGMPYEFEIQKSEIGNLHVVRPLLDVTRAEIEAYGKENGLTPRVDSSNLDTTFFRNRLRHEVLPYLETLNPGLRSVLLHSARALADDYAFVQAEVEKAFAAVAQAEDGLVVFAQPAWRALPPALRRGTLRLAIQKLRSDLRNIDWTHIEDAQRIASEKGTGAAATLPGGLLLLIGYDEFVIGQAARVRGGGVPTAWPQLQVDELLLSVPGVTALPDSPWAVETELLDQAGPAPDRWTALLDADQAPGPLALRRRQPGDRFQPAGRQGHTRPLNRFLIDVRVPQTVRDRLPLLVAGSRILWVCGLRVDERARVTPTTRRLLRVTFRKKETS